jgi:hypothetical protein
MRGFERGAYDRYQTHAKPRNERNLKRAKALRAGLDPFNDHELIRHIDESMAVWSKLITPIEPRAPRRPRGVDMDNVGVTVAAALDAGGVPLRLGEVNRKTVFMEVLGPARDARRFVHAEY